MWAAFEVHGDYKLHPDFWRAALMGDWELRASLREAFVEELRVINAICLAVGGKPLFRNTYDDATRRPDFATDLADGYRQDGSMEPHDERSNVSAAGSMDTSIDDQAQLWAGMVRGDGLSAASRAELVRPQAPIRSAHQFPTLKPDTATGNAAIALAAGLGVVTFRDRSGLAWFKGGHNDSTGNMVLCLETLQRCVVLLSNDVRAERIYPELAHMVLGRTAMPWWWEYEWATPGS